jgi:hypothetical protein
MICPGEEQVNANWYHYSLCECPVMTHVQPGTRLLNPSPDKMMLFIIKMETELGVFYAKTDVFLRIDCEIKPGIGYI